jgi:hypothetical protein
MTHYDLTGCDGISIDQFISTMLTVKFSASMTGNYLKDRAGRGDRSKYEAILSNGSGTTSKPWEQDIDCLTNSIFGKLAFEGGMKANHNIGFGNSHFD